MKTKHDHAAPARHLYTSPLVRGRRAYVERSCARWFILSAKHGLLSPEVVIEPYNQTLKGRPRAEKRAWSDRVLEQLKSELKHLNGLHFEIYAGADYHDHGLAQGLKEAGAAVVLPWQGLGLGKRLA